MDLTIGTEISGAIEVQVFYVCMLHLGLELDVGELDIFQSIKKTWQHK